VLVDDAMSDRRGQTSPSECQVGGSGRTPTGSLSGAWDPVPGITARVASSERSAAGSAARRRRDDPSDDGGGDDSPTVDSRSTGGGGSTGPGGLFELVDHVHHDDRLRHLTYDHLH
jgi:hypothetical protein